MKTLFLIRHAKSSWKDLTLDDFDRPLNKRGKHDAPFMAKNLQEKGVSLDLIISSPALRARKTSEKFAKCFGLKNKQLIWKKKIYEARESELLKIIKNINPKHSSIALVGHNPEITNFSNALCNKYIYNIPTTGIVEIQFDINDWSKIREKSGRFISFDYPKKYVSDSLDEC